MFNEIFLTVFTLLLISANVYCFIKKKYIYLFIPCLLFLPFYYGIEISYNLPLISATRIMYVIFFVYAFVNKRRTIVLRNISLKNLPKEYLLLTGYFVLRFISNLFYVTTYKQALNNILLLIFEQLFLLIGMYILAPTKEELIKTLKIVLWTACVLFVAGIAESITSVRAFNSLYTISREVYNIPYYRLGLLRSTTCMYAPALYGNMCILVIPVILYLFEETRSKRYLVVAGLDTLAIIHSGTRADMIFLIIVLFIYFILVLKTRERRLYFLKNCGIVTVSLLMYMIIASLCSPLLKYYYTGNVKSVLNEVGFDFDLNEGAPPDSQGFGKNQYGSSSRIRQFTGMYYVARLNPLFGLGAGAATRGDIQYYWHFGPGDDRWRTIGVYDVGIVEIFCDEGLIGLLGMILLILFMADRSRKNDLLKYALFCYLITTLATKTMYSYLFVYLIILMSFGKGCTNGKTCLSDNM